MKKISYNIVRIFNLLFAILPTLGFYRATVQSEYNWGLLAISGTGRSEEYLYLTIFMILAWSSFLLERWYKRKWYYFFPGILFGTSFMVTLAGILSGGDMSFQGDAWGINVNLGIIFVVITIIPLISLVLWCVKDLKDFTPQTITFGKSLFISITAVALISVAILLLFADGEGGVHSNFDRMAVAFTILQSLALAYVNESVGDKNQDK